MFDPIQPLYVLPQNKKRGIIPKTLILVILSVILYIGILLNISLLELTPPEETNSKFVALIALILIDLLGFILSTYQASRPYLFYQDNLRVGKKEIYYTTMTTPSSRQNFADRFFHTYSLNLGNNQIMRNIPEQVQIQNYLQQLIERAKKTQPPL